MADKTRPWSSISKLNDAPWGTMTVPRHCQKTKEWVVAQFLEISTPSPKQMKQFSHWLTYEITQPIKTIQPHGPHSLCGVCSSLNLDKSTSYLSFCLSLDSFCIETSRTWASLGPEISFHGFWLGSNSMQGFGWVQILATWVRAPNGFLLGLSSST